jgi:glycosyltransferase involved in cell wall biosynthesis
MKLSIVIPTLNHCDVTQECLDAILKHTKNEYELILIDDGSDDDTTAIEMLYPIDTLIRNRVNRGFAVAVNEGIRQCRGDYICIFNNDMIVQEGWDEILIGYLEKLEKEKYGMVTGTLLEPADCKREDFSLAKPTKKGCLLWEKGGPWMFKKDVFKFTGIFDEIFEYCQYEDLDFLTRMAYAGYKHGRVEECLVYHYSQLTQKGELKKRIGTDYVVQNRAKFIKKWGTAEIDFEKALAEEPQCA